MTDYIAEDIAADLIAMIERYFSDALRVKEHYSSSLYRVLKVLWLMSKCATCGCPEMKLS